MQVPHVNLVHIFNKTSIHFFSSLASKNDVKKLSVVMFLSLPMNGSMRVMTTLSLSLWVDGRDSSLHRYGMAFRIYLDFTSTAYQNYMQNLSGVIGMYWVYLQRNFVEDSCSLTVIFSPGLCVCVCVCVYPSSSLGWRYGMNGNSGSCRQPN